MPTQTPHISTVAQATRLLRPLGIRIRCIQGEYQVYRDSNPCAAYFTSDLTDAVGTGRLMYEQDASDSPPAIDLSVIFQSREAEKTITINSNLPAICLGALAQLYAGDHIEIRCEGLRFVGKAASKKCDDWIDQFA
jgi:hypothetical protein